MADKITIECGGESKTFHGTFELLDVENDTTEGEPVDGWVTREMTGTGTVLVGFAYDNAQAR